MKKTILLVLSALWIIPTTLCWAADAPASLDLKVKAEFWAAHDTKYTETSSVPGSNGPHGRLSTNFLKLSVEKGFGKIYLEAALTRGEIEKQKMYLDHAETEFVDIDGNVNTGEINTYYRIGSPSRYLDLGVGYLYSTTTKEFYNHVTAGIPDAARQGNFGRFKMAYHGPTVRVRGRATIGSFGLEGLGSYGRMWNNVKVEGWPGGPTSENANGHKYTIEGAVLWIPLSMLEVKGGYRHEVLYFDPSSEGKHDLYVKFNGPFLSAAWTF